MSPLLSWLDAPAGDRGIQFAGGTGWDFWSYARLASLTRAVAAGLSQVPPGAVVATVQRSGPQMVATLFGAMLAGCVPAPLAPPTRLQARSQYASQLAAVLRAAHPRLVVADPDLPMPPLDAAVADAGTLLAAGDGRRDRAAHALLQFTSGSSGVARGTRQSFGAVEANIGAIRQWLGMTGADATATWLPAHHDMGLIGCLLTPVVNGSDIWMMQPEQFVHRPRRYLECFGRHGCRLTAMPAFGLAHLVRRVRPGDLDGLDLRDWRAVIVGAERVDPGLLDDFHRLLAPAGLARGAILPAYGLAECTLAVTGVPPGRGWTTLPVDPGSIRLGRRVRPPAPGGPRLDVAGCGSPLAGVEVTIRGAEADGVVGEIVAGGTRTGDAGFRHGGELFVLGRLGDSMKVRGRTLFAEDLEALLVAAGVPARRVACLLGDRDGEPTVVVVVEQARPQWRAAAERLLGRNTGGARVVVVDAPRGAIARTGNGKVRRRQMWHEFLYPERRNEEA